MRERSPTSPHAEVDRLETLLREKEQKVLQLQQSVRTKLDCAAASSEQTSPSGDRFWDARKSEGCPLAALSNQQVSPSKKRTLILYGSEYLKKNGKPVRLKPNEPFQHTCGHTCGKGNIGRFPGASYRRHSVDNGATSSVRRGRLASQQYRCTSVVPRASWNADECSRREHLCTACSEYEHDNEGDTWFYRPTERQNSSCKHKYLQDFSQFSKPMYASRGWPPNDSFSRSYDSSSDENQYSDEGLFQKICHGVVKLLSPEKNRNKMSSTDTSGRRSNFGYADVYIPRTQLPYNRVCVPVQPCSDQGIRTQNSLFASFPVGLRSYMPGVSTHSPVAAPIYATATSAIHPPVVSSVPASAPLPRPYISACRSTLYHSFRPSYTPVRYYRQPVMYPRIAPALYAPRAVAHDNSRQPPARHPPPSSVPVPSSGTQQIPALRQSHIPSVSASLSQPNTVHYATSCPPAMPTVTPDSPGRMRQIPCSAKSTRFRTEDVQRKSVETSKTVPETAYIEHPPTIRVDPPPPLNTLWSTRATTGVSLVFPNRGQTQPEGSRSNSYPDSIALDACTTFAVKRSESCDAHDRKPVSFSDALSSPGFVLGQRSLSDHSIPQDIAYTSHLVTDDASDNSCSSRPAPATRMVPNKTRPKYPATSPAVSAPDCSQQLFSNLKNNSSVIHGPNAYDCERRARKKALCIGVSAPGKLCALEGAAKDALQVKDKLNRAPYNFNTRLLVDAQHNGLPASIHLPTKENVLAGISWLVEDAAPGDILLLYYAGCSARVADAEACGVGEDALVPTDFGFRGTDDTVTVSEVQPRLLYSEEIYQILAVRLSPGIQLTAIFDTTFSSTLIPTSSYLKWSPKTGWQAALRNDKPILVQRPAPPLWLRWSPLQIKDRTLNAPLGTGFYRISHFKGFFQDPLGVGPCVTAANDQDDHERQLPGAAMPSVFVFHACADTKEEAHEAYLEGKSQGLFTYCFLQALDSLSSVEVTVSFVFETMCREFQRLQQSSKIPDIREIKQSFLLSFSTGVLPFQSLFLSHCPVSRELLSDITPLPAWEALATKPFSPSTIWGPDGSFDNNKIKSHNIALALYTAQSIRIPKNLERDRCARYFVGIGFRSLEADSRTVARCPPVTSRSTRILAIKDSVDEKFETCQFGGERVFLRHQDPPTDTEQFLVVSLWRSLALSDTLIGTVTLDLNNVSLLTVKQRWLLRNVEGSPVATLSLRVVGLCEAKLNPIGLG